MKRAKFINPVWPWCGKVGQVIVLPADPLMQLAVGFQADGQSDKFLCKPDELEFLPIPADDVAAILNRFPEVKWDRLAGDLYERFAVFGWIDRPDTKKDFLLLVIAAGAEVQVEMYATSSAQHSQEFGRRLGMEADEHQPCQRVETLFPGVQNAVRLP